MGQRLLTATWNVYWFR